MKIENVALYAKDLEKAKVYFVKYLNGKANNGYYNSKTNFRSYFITFEDGARIEIMTRPEGLFLAFLVLLILLPDGGF